ncbi:GT2 family glycosyltransferase [Terracoccus luteus]|uniref:GT2 family glycosyltransferase n=1 Tax=Terracoccus luteus TaxID=53356 RepID=A0A495XYR5_9MICO|nr:glycosyltransferase family 2 protein [Terracoccus luteus]RKT78469.1 GT2 family glycosyltransferase [Terracoccus luteus]
MSSPAKAGPPARRTAIVVVNYGSHVLLAQNLPDDREPGVDVIVVDSFSTPAERSAVETLAAERNWQLITPDSNVGFGIGCNLGAERGLALGTEVLVFVNPDASLPPAARNRLVATVVADERVVAAPRIERPDGSVWASGTTDLYLESGTMRATRKRPTGTSGPAPRVQTWLSGACFAISAPLWREVGGFDPDYFLYWEDVDLSWRVHEAGGRLVALEDAVAVHDEGRTHSKTGSTRARSGTYYYYNIRNRMMFAHKHLRPSDVRAWRRSSLSAAKAIVLQGGRRQLLTGTTPWTAAARGVRDGLRAGR